MRIFKKLLPLFLLASLAIFTSSCKKDDPKPAPVVNFTFTGANKPAPCEVSFTNSSTNATSYIWEFGDGGSSTSENPKHTYTTGGTFTAQLTATGDGGTNFITKSVTIQNPVADPVANFTFTGGNTFAPCLVTFTNTSTNSTSYNWDFGDGQTSTSQAPTHVFVNGGTFNVTLTAENSIGIQNVINKTVTINNPPTELKIKSIELTGFPPTNLSGGGWDNSNGPDVYFKFSDVDGKNYFETGRYNDVLQSDLPLTFTTGFPITISALDFKYTIELWDYDSLDADDFMGGYFFTVRDWMPTNGDLYPSKLNFQGSSSDLKFTLNIEWVQ